MSGVIINCNKCHKDFYPYPNAFRIPTLDEVACPYCNEKRILYHGNEPSIQRMILSDYGIDKEVNERINDIEGKIIILEKRIAKATEDAKQIMTEALINALRKEIKEHETNYHGYPQ